MTNKKLREIYDDFGTVKVPMNAYYGAQTARSLENFPIGEETFTRPFIKALGIIKKAAAQANLKYRKISPEFAESIIQAADEIVDGKFDQEFPLVIWQTGSGTQTNMNANEVLATRANELLGIKIGATGPIHPNDHCNLSQSSNDTIPTAMHISTALLINDDLLPAFKHLKHALQSKETEFAEIIKIGRTHLQDATPLTMGQEFSGFADQIDFIITKLSDGLDSIYKLAQGATAVGTGLNSPAGFDTLFAEIVSEATGLPFRPAHNKFSAIAAHDSYVCIHGILNAAATSLYKIANDIRLLSSGPRSGLGELTLPANEAGSSIMPGKVNPTQCEALTMVCARVFGNHTTITFAASQGHLELNAYKPVMANAMLQSIQLLADSVNSFTDRCVVGIEVNRIKVSAMVEQSLMLVTALTPHIGYNKASLIVHTAHENHTTIREEAIRLGFVSDHDFDKLVQPELMLTPNTKIDE